MRKRAALSLMVVVALCGACGDSGGSDPEVKVGSTKEFCADFADRKKSIGEIGDTADEMNRLRTALNTIRYPEQLKEEAAAVDRGLAAVIDEAPGDDASKAEQAAFEAKIEKNPDAMAGSEASDKIAEFAEKSC